ncbi:MAG: cation:proton antiporter [Alphaproteobacteria bacterium]|nr:cation:proton antiporter [Alphaproteobacteria bacterium]
MLAPLALAPGAIIGHCAGPSVAESLMPEIFVTVLAVMVLLTCVSLLMPLAERLMLPPAMLLAAFGLGLGFIANALGEGAEPGIAETILRGLAGLELGTDALLLIFLPPLLFTAGLTIDVRLLIDEFAAVLLLAVVAVVVSILVVGGALSAVTQLGLVACLLLGAIIAPTDPAAVVALFRDIGAPRRLSILVAGESLFNDAAAIAGFVVLLAMVTGAGGVGPAAGVLNFLLVMVGGALFGYLIAAATCAILPWLREISVAEITLTVPLAYMSYLVAEVWLSVSGVVAVVTAALTFAVYGRTRLAPATWGTLTQTWRHLEFWANSMIFILASMLAAQVLPEARAADVGLLALLVAAALAARALVLYGLWPALVAAGLGEPIGHRYKAVILWGGLRGAVTLALALAVYENPFVPGEIQNFVAVLATAYVLFTLFAGAPSLRPLLHALKLDQLSPTERALRDRVMALSRQVVGEEVRAVAREYGLDSDAVSPPSDSAEGAPAGAARLHDMEQIGLMTLANREKQLYLKHFEERTISRRMVGRFVASANRLVDRVKTAGEAGYERASQMDVQLSRAFRVALWLHRRLGWSAPLARVLADRFETLIILRLVLAELIRFNRTAIHPLLGADCSDALSDLLVRRRQAVEDALSALELLYPGYTAALRRQYLQRVALRVEAAEYHDRFQESLIGRELYNHLLEDLRVRRAALEHRPQLDLGFDLLEMIGRVPLFANLEQERLMAIAQLLRPRLALPGERLVRKGAQGGQMYFVVAGAVEVHVAGGPISLGPGEFFGELALLTRRPRTADVVAVGYCHLLVLEDRDFRKLLRANPVLEADIRAVADTRLAEVAQESAAAGE